MDAGLRDDASADPGVGRKAWVHSAGVLRTRTGVPGCYCHDRERGGLEREYKKGEKEGTVGRRDLGPAGLPWSPAGSGEAVGGW